MRRGEAYKGPATLFGKTFMTAYYPIVNPAGKVIGILYRHSDGAVRDHAVACHPEHGHRSRHRGAAGDDADHGAGAPRDQAADLGHGLADRDRQRQRRRRDRLPRAHGRDRRDRANARRLQEQLGRTPPRRADAAAAAAAEQRKSELRGFVDEFQTSVGSILDKVLNSSSEFERVARQLTETARTTAGLSGKSAGASETASEHVRSAATASDELSSSIAEITRRVQGSNGIAADAVKQAAATDQRINELSEAGARIGDVVKLITSIAEQTNLLALNATIEAARRATPAAALPWWRRRSRASPARPRRRPRRSPARSATCSLRPKSSVSAIKAIGQTIERISDIATSISAAVEQQRGATQNIAQSVRAAASGTADVAVNIRNAAQGADETGETSSRMFASAQNLSSESLHLKAEVEVPRSRPRGLIGASRRRTAPPVKLEASRFVVSYTANDCPRFRAGGHREPIRRALSGDAVRHRSD